MVKNKVCLPCTNVSANWICRHLARNPFHCDCRIGWIVDWMSAFPVETSGARCEGPKKMHKRKLASLRQDQLKCYGEFFQNIVQKSFFYAMINDTDGWSDNKREMSWYQNSLTNIFKGLWSTSYAYKICNANDLSWKSRDFKVLTKCRIDECGVGQLFW